MFFHACRPFRVTLRALIVVGALLTNSISISVRTSATYYPLKRFVSLATHGVTWTTLVFPRYRSLVYVKVQYEFAERISTMFCMFLPVHAAEENFGDTSYLF